MSTNGPVQIELFQEAPGTPWQSEHGSPPHHVCHWISDLHDEITRFRSQSFYVEGTMAGPEVANGFAYLLGPDRLRAEPDAIVGRAELDGRQSSAPYSAAGPSAVIS